VTNNFNSNNKKVILSDMEFVTTQSYSRNHHRTLKMIQFLVSYFLSLQQRNKSSFNQGIEIIESERIDLVIYI